MAAALFHRGQWQVLLLVLQLGWGIEGAAAQAPAPTPPAPAPAGKAAPKGAAKPAPSTADAPAPTPKTDVTSAVGAPAAKASAGGDADVLTTACADSADNTKLPPSSAKFGRVLGVIFAPSSEPPNVVLTLSEKSTSNRYEVGPGQFFLCTGRKGSAWRFAYWRDVPPGTYDLSLSGAKYESRAVSGIAVGASDVRQQDFSLVREETVKDLLVLWVAPLFLLSIWLIRWNNIAKPSRLGVIAQLKDLKLQFASNNYMAKELEEKQAEMERKYAVLDWLFWSRGQEMASWNLIHKADIQLLKSADPEEINARLSSAEQRLSEIDKATAKGLADRIGAEFKCDPTKVNGEMRRQLLIEATRFLFDNSDTEFAALTSWQNKAFWLTLVGVMLIFGVGLSEGHASLFLAGAVGGFLSRLTRQLKRADVPTDYGASWSTLFLSPVAGAISGWFGVALIMLLTDPTVGVLGGPLKVINWDSHNVAAALAAAFVLGFSERLFDKIVSQLEDSIDKKKEDAQKATPKPASPPTPDTGKPRIAKLSPNPANPGVDVTAQLNNLDASEVTRVELLSPGGDAVTIKDVKVEGAKLKFTIPADLAPKEYKVALFTTERIETEAKLTVVSAQA